MCTIVYGFLVGGISGMAPFEARSEPMDRLNFRIGGIAQTHGIGSHGRGITPMVPGGHGEKVGCTIGG